MSTSNTPAASTPKKSHVLIILDGYGHRVDSHSNAIQAAQTPVMDALSQDYPNRLISTSGADVGLPDGQMGNSEVGHMNLGAGRVVYQDFTRISKSISDQAFTQTPALCDVIQRVKQSESALHIIGLLSPGGVHSHEDHIAAMIEMAHQQGAKRVYLHAFLDGRDTPPRSAEASLVKISALFERLNCGRIASLIGRYYAMDRDNRWDRIQTAYDMLTQGAAQFQADTAIEGLQQSYQRDEGDEFVQATLIGDTSQASAEIRDNDGIVFMNFRADRARQLTQAFIDPSFDGFKRTRTPRLANFIMLTQYSESLKTTSAFPPQTLKNSLGEYLSDLGKTQLRIAETEKYAHVTFFFSGGKEDCYAGEERILVPSPDVATYDLQPEMSAPELTQKLVGAIQSGQFDLIVCNYANGDMVGHTGNFDAAVKAVETLDQCIGEVVEVVKASGGDCLITADHGNAEQMSDLATGQPHTAHTCEPVPLIYVGRDAKMSSTDGALSDIAPTLLHLMGIDQPPQMTGHNLVEFDPQ